MHARKKKPVAKSRPAKRRAPSVLRSAVRTCLDTEIRAWRVRRLIASDPHAADQADDSIKAFQFVRTALLGKPLAEEPVIPDLAVEAESLA